MVATSKHFALGGIGETLMRKVKGKFVAALRNWSEVTRTVRKVHAESGHFGRDPALIGLKTHALWFGNMAEDVTDVLRGRP